MTEHKGTSFYNSCVKVPVDPYSRQPTPSYERPGLAKCTKYSNVDKRHRTNFTIRDQSVSDSLASSPRETVDNFLDFLESIPDYGQVHHLSNEQFKQKVHYLKRKQKLLLENLQNSLADREDENASKLLVSKSNDERLKIKSKKNVNNLKLNGKKCYLAESRTSSPIMFASGRFVGPAEDQDFLTNRYKEKDKEAKTARNEIIHSADKNWSAWNRSKGADGMESDTDSIETRSLPASTSKEWHPTVPKPFSFTLREEAEKYMTHAEMEAEHRNVGNSKKSSSKNRRVRPIPITSKIPLYNKLLADKEERSRMVREESALNLMSQVRPFKLECDRRAWRYLARSSPEIRGRSINTNAKFKAKPVPKNLFSTDIYDRMLEDEYYRQLQKKVRAAELLKSSSLPPSMARRERVKSACTRLKDTSGNFKEGIENKSSSNNSPMPLERCRSAMSLLPQPQRGNNLAAILRCQISREKLEREIREKMEERRREQAVKLKASVIGRNPVWRALRSAARYEHERDLSIRTSLRRDEAREQAERHRLQMEIMLDRVTEIPTLFERHSQNYRMQVKKQPKGVPKSSQRKKKKKQLKEKSSSIDSYIGYENISRPDSDSVTSSSGTLISSNQSLKSSNVSERSTDKSQRSKKKGDRAQLKVSINEKAELIEDQNGKDKLDSDESCSSDERGENVWQSDEHDLETEI